MAKKIKLHPLGTETAVQTNANLLSGLLKNDLHILQECGGRGMCSTCHVFIKDGMESLSPLNRREIRTLEVVTSCQLNSRLACQTRVLGEGVVVELPEGMYVSEIEDIEALVGRRAEQDILHPITGQILVEAGKLIVRSMITKLTNTQGEVSDYINRTREQ